MEPPKSIRDVQKLTGRIAALGRFVSKSGDKCLPFFKALKKVKNFEWTKESQVAFEELKKYMAEPPLLLKPIDGEILYVYLAVSEQALSAVLVRVELKVQKPVYYVSKVFHGAELNYSLDFPTTNNEAEYEALIAGLGLARTLRVRNLKVCGDSKLVVFQVNGEFEAREDTMVRYLRIVKTQMALFEECIVEYVPREENTKADALSQFESSDDEICSGSVYYQVMRTPSIDAKLVAPIDTGATWMDEIKLYLENGHLPTNADEARKLQVRALKYVLIEGILYRKSFVIPYLRCLRPDEAREALREVHEGVCGQHLGGRALAHKATRLGFYWPEMLKHAQDYVKRCDRCQKFAPIVRQPPEMLTSINTPIPFAMWGMDILGPFPLASAQRKFLLVAIDYFTKWIEAKPLAKITTKQVAQFVWENIICRYGIPRIMVIDNGTQFNNAEFKNYCEDYSIELRFTSVAHPQANGQDNPRWTEKES
ncbi:uncharacterized protein LOC135147954 [Daucus carota subsp. sativus]|uniref:uncharacterized protein LOC135147954 n=1 Tax=Daucus carota subsp. sativus TaxID=79200 RepID=UPI0007F03753|nr:PREDICTED: uncharacterized protein LOC108194831 [Daucus carota subsp. sativus]